MKRDRRRSRRRVRVPRAWRALSWLVLIPVGVLVSLVIFRKSGGVFPLQAGQSTDPYFFGAIFGILTPLLLYVFVVDKILRGIVQKRSGGDIAADVAKDIGKATAEMAVEAVLGGDSSDDRRGSSSGDTSGGGGGFGGGGASGGY